MENPTQAAPAKEPEKSPKSSKKEGAQMVAEGGVLKPEHLPKVMEEFRRPIEAGGLQSTKGEETKKGYDTLGYGYAYISERLNDVVGFCWRMVTSNETINPVKSANNNDMFDVSVDVVIQLGNWKNKEIEKKVFEGAIGIVPSSETCTTSVETVRYFEVLAESPVGYGQHKGMAKADSRKGALTNGFKKAAGFLGIGNEAYKKSIDEENQEIKDALAKKNSKKKPGSKYTAPAGSSGNLDNIKKKLFSMGAKTEKEAVLMLAERFNFDCDGLDKLSEKQQKLVLARILQGSKSSN